MNAQQEVRAQAVCRLEVLDGSGQVIGGGSGFHFGGGWILTNSHVVGQDASQLPQIRITFDRSALEFQPRKRVCFFVNLTYRANRSPDMDRADVALFPLEESEKPWPLGMNDQSWKPLAVPLAPGLDLKAGMETYCLHFGWGGNNHPPPNVLVSPGERVARIIAPTTQNVPFIVQRDGYSTSAGSSGAPLFASNHELVGIHFATGVAVLFSPTIRELLDSLRLAIAEIWRVPQILTIWNESSSAHLRTALWDQVKGMMDNILLSLGRASAYMRVIIPVGERILTFP